MVIIFFYDYNYCSLKTAVVIVTRLLFLIQKGNPNEKQKLKHNF